jgi:hypothetical protein
LKMNHAPMSMVLELDMHRTSAIIIEAKKIKACMEVLASYTNKKGENFTIAFEEPHVQENAGFWGFFYRVTDSKKRGRIFRLVIKKSFMQEKQLAKNFSQGLPLQTLHGLLETVERGRAPLFLPDTTKGWEVF